VAHIRRLLRSESTGENPLDARLRDVVDTAELLGLRVHWQGGLDSSDLPPAVMAALADAAREALNNVAAHAGTAECWLTLMADHGRVTLRVVDRGRGFDPSSRPPGFGLRRSLLDRMAACGGAVRLTSAPGSGTCVDLMWPK
jgi:signal transduction histidine kinase